MKNKTKITQDNYKEIVLKRAIIICWVLLIICFVIKLFGGNFFSIACTNKNFTKFCDLIDKTIVRYILYYLLFNITMYLLVLVADPQIKIKSRKFVIYLIIVTLTWIFKLLIELQILKINIIFLDVFDFVFYFVVLLCMIKKPLRSFITMLLLFIYTILSVFVKNLGAEQVITESYLIMTLYMIDYYIMLTLTALYSKILYLRRIK